MPRATPIPKKVANVDVPVFSRRRDAQGAVAAAIQTALAKRPEIDAVADAGIAKELPMAHDLHCDASPSRDGYHGYRMGDRGPRDPWASEILITPPDNKLWVKFALTQVVVERQKITNMCPGFTTEERKHNKKAAAMASMGRVHFGSIDSPTLSPTASGFPASGASPISVNPSSLTMHGQSSALGDRACLHGALRLSRTGRAVGSVSHSSTAIPSLGGSPFACPRQCWDTRMLDARMLDASWLAPPIFGSLDDS